jgi:probable addiction module antidote protein
MKKRVPYVLHDEEQIKEFRRRPEFALEYLNACLEIAFEENDPELVLAAMADVAKAFGINRIAKGAHLRRESLHRMLSRRGNPRWDSMFKVLKAMRLGLTIERVGALPS